MNIDWKSLLKIGAGVAAVGAAGYGVGKWAASRQSTDDEDGYEYDDEEEYEEYDDYNDEEYDDYDDDNEDVVYIKGIPYIEDENGNYVPYEEDDEVVYINGFPYVMDENGNYTPQY